MPDFYNFHNHSLCSRHACRIPIIYELIVLVSALAMELTVFLRPQVRGDDVDLVASNFPRTSTSRSEPSRDTKTRKPTYIVRKVRHFHKGWSNRGHDG